MAMGAVLAQLLFFLVDQVVDCAVPELSVNVEPLHATAHYGSDTWIHLVLMRSRRACTAPTSTSTSTQAVARVAIIGRLGVIILRKSISNSASHA